MSLYIRQLDGKPRTADYVRKWINRNDLPDPFTPVDVVPYGWEVYVAPPPQLPSVEDMREAARTAINYWRNEEEAKGFTALGHNWDSTPASREKITNTHLGGQGSPTGYWTSADDVDVPNANAAFIAALWGAMVTRGAEIHARQRAMKTAVDSMTAEQLNGFVPGWA